MYENTMENAELAEVIQGSPIEEAVGRQLPIAVPEIRTMLKIISWISWVNLLIALPSVLLVFTLKSYVLFSTGILSLLTFWLLRMVVRHIRQSKSWAEVGVIAMCGVYFPAYIMWLCIGNLVEAILH
jgi:hypothetical protein